MRRLAVNLQPIEHAAQHRQLGWIEDTSLLGSWAPFFYEKWYKINGLAPNRGTLYTLEYTLRSPLDDAFREVLRPRMV